MQIADMSWVGSEASLAGSATYTVDEASMTLALPDFKTANSVHFLLQCAAKAGRYQALREVHRMMHQEITRLEDRL